MIDDNSFKKHLDECFVRIRTQKYDKSTIDGLFKHLSKLLQIVVTESVNSQSVSRYDPTTEDESSFGPLVSDFIESGLLMQLVSWGTSSSHPPPDVKNHIFCSLLKDFEFLISQAKQNLLYSNVVFQSLLMLIDPCSTVSSDVCRNLGIVLYTLCVLLCRDPLLLEFTKQVSRDVTHQEYFIFSKLVPLLHLQDDAGNKARDALLLILSLSSRDPDVAHYLTSKSDICPVLATGLSGLYSSLPKCLTVLNGVSNVSDRSSSETLHVYGAGWHQITKLEWSACEPLVQFLKTLDFCDLAVRVSHPSVRKDLLFYIYSGFLMSVLGSALLQNSMEEVIAAEAYLDLFLRRLTEPALIGLFLRFIVASNFDNHPVLSALTSRLDASTLLGTVTLSLFRTILNLNCEDVMFLLIFQYLNALDFHHKFDTNISKETSLNPAFSTEGDWLSSARCFLNLSSWCTRFKGSTEGADFVGHLNSRVMSCLSESHRAITSRVLGTSMWSAEYHTVLPIPPLNLLVDPSPVQFHSTPLKSPSHLKIQPVQQLEPSIIDRYKSESTVYQLSYCNDFGDEDDEEVKNTEEKGLVMDTSQPVSPMILSSPRPIRSSLASIRRLLTSTRDLPNSDAVSQLIRVLEEEFPSIETTQVNTPIPPVSQFTFDLLDYRLGRTSDVPIAALESAVKYEKLGVKDDPLDADYDFAVVCKNELPELRFRINKRKSSLPACGSGFGPFIDSLFKQLGSMHKNDFYKNLLLTEIVTILATFHQYPLADILLKNVKPQSKTLVQSLYQILCGLRTEIEKSLAMIPNWPALVEQAMLFLREPPDRNPNKVLPEAVVLNANSVTLSEDDVLAATSLSSSKANPNKIPGLPPLSSYPRGRPHNPPSRELHPASHRSSSATPLNMNRHKTAVLEPMAPTQLAVPRPNHQRRLSTDRLSNSNTTVPPPVVSSSTRNIIYAYIVFNEFCLDLASLCCEHEVSLAVVLPQFERTMDFEHSLAEM